MISYKTKKEMPFIPVGTEVEFVEGEKGYFFRVKHNDFDGGYVYTSEEFDKLVEQDWFEPVLPAPATEELKEFDTKQNIGITGDNWGVNMSPEFKEHYDKLVRTVNKLSINARKGGEE